ncbi:hypothetical protein BGY98DRAFT_963883, partial [Russula aff. rugulosa BPL654]
SGSPLLYTCESGCICKRSGTFCRRLCGSAFACQRQWTLCGTTLVYVWYTVGNIVHIQVPHGM